MYEIKNLGAEKDDYESLLFVLKAKSSDETRPFMCVLHVERTKSGSRLVATDGRRLHVAEIGTKLESGEYDVIIAKNSVILKENSAGLQFPNWKRVVPEKTIDKGTINLEKSGLGKNDSKAAEMSIAFGKFLEKTGEIVNLRYLEDLPKAEWSLLCQSEKRRAVMLKRGDRGKESYAVIMPLDVAAA